MHFTPKLPKNLPDYLTTQELSQLLGVCGGTIRNWLKKGILPHPVRMTTKMHVFNTERVRKALADHFPELLGAGQGGAAAAAAAPREDDYLLPAMTADEIAKELS